VGLDPTYAPAWGYLGIRYHYDAAYSTGGDEMRKRSDAALERALSLDPDFIFADAWLITNWVEKSELAKAYQAAKALVARHPENAAAHFALAYVDRYGGAIEESAHECDTALSLDPGNFTLRSCLFTFEQSGNYARGMEFLQLDTGSAWASGNLARQYFRAGKLAEARELAQKFNDVRWSRMIVACTDNPSSENAIKLARDEAAEVLADPDPEVHYVVASDFLVCGQKDLTLKLLKTSIDGHYCAYTGLQNDSVWSSVRGRPEFEEIVREAKRCQDDFRAEIAKVQ
jgi:tetratricopeptide (TPR) repeat protein